VYILSAMIFVSCKTRNSDPQR